MNKIDAIKTLKTMLKPGSDVYTIISHVSASGMSRSVRVILPVSEKENVYPTDNITGRKDYNNPRVKKVGKVRDVSWLVACALGLKFDQNNGGVKVGGCGMDMAFSVVYDMGMTLWPKGTRKPHSTRNGEPDTCSGYALNKVSL